MAQQETVADRLVRVIQSIQLAQESGLLTVRRGTGGTLEEGTVTFVKGQVTQTIAGRRQGKAALNWLSTWVSCRYIFVPSTTASSESSVPVSMTGAESVAAVDTQPRLPISQSGTEPSGGVGAPQARPGDTPLPLNRNLLDSFPLGASTIAFPTQPLEEALRRIEQGRLSRTHRQLFLLIDGQRPVIDVARLVGKSQEEVNRVLLDLARIGVIHLGGE